jgi:adenosylcobinamide kinase/adenosylcobinamide-phosphate guanylyltransferase
MDTEVIEQGVTDEITQLIDCMNNSEASFIVVTNEVGAGLVPASAMARLYRDLLGKANQMLGQHADHVYLMVAGLPLQVKP